MPVEEAGAMQALVKPIVSRLQRRPQLLVAQRFRPRGDSVYVGNGALYLFQYGDSVIL